MGSPLFVVYHQRLEGAIDLGICCYTLDLDTAEGALEEYAMQTVGMLNGNPNPDALDDERPIEKVGAGHHLRYDDDTDDRDDLAVYPSISVWRVRKPGDFVRVQRFGILNANMWKDDFLDEITPAVEELAASDTTSGAVYAANRPGGRVDRMLRGEGNYASDDEAKSI